MAAQKHTDFVDGLGTNPDLRTLFDYDLNTAAKDPAAAPGGEEPLLAVFRLDSGFGELQSGISSTAFSGFDTLVVVNLTELNLASPELGVYSGLSGSATTPLGFDGVLNSSRQDVTALNANTVWATLIPESTSSIDLSIAGGFGFNDLAISDGEVHYLTQSRPVSGNLGPEGATDVIAGVNNLTQSVDGNQVYALTENRDALVVIDAATRQVVQVFEESVNGVQTLDSTTSITASVDGKHVYVTGSGGSMGVFLRDTVSGSLTFSRIQNLDPSDTSAPTVEHLAIRPTSETAFALLNDSGTHSVRTFSRDTNSGLLNADGNSLSLGSDVVDVSLNGDRLYVLRANALESYSAAPGTSFLTQLETVTNVTGDHIVGTSNHVHILDGTTDSVRTFSFDAAGDLQTLQTVTNFANGVSSMDGPIDLVESADGSLAYVVARDSNAISVIKIDGSGEQVQRLRNNSGGLVGFVAPNSSQAGPSDSVWVATSGNTANTGGITTFNLLNGNPDPQSVRAVFDGIENVSVGTAGGADLINILHELTADVGMLSVDTGANTDEVTINAHSTTTTISLGAGDDIARLQTSSDGAITINGDAGEDEFDLRQVGSSTTTILNGGDDADLFKVAGQQVPATATTTIHGNDPTTIPGDTLRYVPETGTVTENGTPSNGNISVTGRGRIDYTTLEAVDQEAGPIITPISIPASINEGQDLTLSVSVNPRGTGNQLAGLTWAVDGQQVGNANSTILTIPWSDLRFEFGVGDGPGNFNVSILATNADGISTPRVFTIAVNNVAPNIAITANSGADVSHPFALQAAHSDPGTDSPINWVVDWGDGTAVSTFGALTTISGTHAYDEPGQYTVTVSVVDEDSTPAVAASTTHVVSVTANQADISAGGPYVINEGEGLTLSGSAVGNWQFAGWDLTGNNVINDALGLTPSLSWTDLVALGITDDVASLPVVFGVQYPNGDIVGSVPTTLTVLNVDPTATLSNNAPTAGIDEGTGDGVVNVSFSDITDAVLDDLVNLTYSFDFDNDGTFEIVDGTNSTASVPAQYLGNSGLVTVRGRVSDNDGGVSEYLTSFTVNEVLPTFELQGADSAVEGADYLLTIANLVDAGTGDVISALDIDWGDGSAIESVAPVNGTITHRFADDLPTTAIRVTAIGPDGSTTVTKNVAVTNANPQWSNLSVSNAAGGTSIFESDFVRLTADLFDPGVLDSFDQLTINWGDGDSATITSLAAETTEISATHAYANDGVYTITLDVTDDDGGSATATIDVTVLNAAPELSLALDQANINETGSVLLSGSVTDAGLVDAHTVVIDWADGAPTDSVSVIDGRFSASHIYADDNPSGSSADLYSIQVTAIDSADASSSVTDSIDLTVNNLNPVLLSVSNTASRFTDAIGPGELVTASAEFDEPSAADTFTVTVNWGDGTVDNTPTVTFDPTNGIYRVTAQHTYSVDGRYPITFSVLDDDLGSAESTVDAIITSPGANAVPVIDNQTFNISEDTAAGTDIATVVASDANTPQGDMLLYSIVPGSLERTDAVTGSAAAFPVDVFAIDSATGTLTLANPVLFDREATERFTFQVAVEDSFTATSTATISIVLSDVNEFGPSADSATFVVRESDATGFVPGQLVATDADADDVLTFSTDPGPFAVSSTGEVTIADAALVDFDNNVRYTIPFTVTDQGGLTTSAIFTVNLNAAPRLEPIGDQTIDESDSLTFTAVGNDPGLIDNVIRYSLDANAPAGAAIDPLTGDFTWTPTEDQGPATYNVTVRVSDNGTPAQSTAETITITVGEVNSNPILAPIGNQSVDEETELTFTATATDADLPANTLTFSLDPGAPTGATIDPQTGVFSWTPTEAQGPAIYSITIRVTDDGTPALDDFETISVSVGEVNNAPVLAPIGDRFINEDNLLTFTASATDVDLPANELTFSLDPGAPTGAAIDPITGVFTWTPTEDQGPAFVDITIRVTDNGSPALDDFETITVQVGNFAPEIFVDNAVVTFNEGQTATNTGTFFDPDNDAVTLTASFGTIVDNQDGTWSWSFDSNDGPAQSQQVIVTATDSDNDFTSATFQLNIENVAPVVQLNAVQAIVENGVATLTGTITDPGTQDTFTLTINWGDPLSANNTETYTFPASASGTQNFTLTHQYLDDNGPGGASDQYTIAVEVTDSDADSGTASQSVTVNNIAPTLQLNAVDAILENGIATLTGTITDPGTLDTFTVEVNWGDPRSPNNFETYSFAASNSGTQNFTLTHQYLDDDADDQYTISVVLTDDDTSTDDGTIPVTVTNVAPNISSLLATSPDGTLLNSASINGIDTSFSNNNLFANSDFESTPALTQTGQNNQPFDVFSAIDNWSATGRWSSIEVHDGDHGTGVSSGNQVVELARYQAISQTIIVDQAGRFEFSLDVAKRNTHSSRNGVRVLLDGEEFDRIHPVANSLETYTYTLDLFPGQHTFEFEGLSHSKHEGSVVDNIRLSQTDTLDGLHLDLCVHSDGDVQLSGTFADISPIDTHEITVDWGDGHSEILNQFTDLNRDFLGNHNYSEGGVYEITVTLIDDDGGTDVETALVAIRGTSVIDGTLYVIGTDGNDDIRIRESGNNLRIYENLAGESPRNIYVPTADVHSIMIGSSNGNDFVSLNRPAHIPASIQAKGGNNRIYASDGQEIITTGDGKDTIRIADGLFSIDAGDGRNVIDGGHGDGTIDTGDDYDIVRIRSGNHTINVGDGGSYVRVNGHGDNIITAGHGYDSITTGNGNQTIDVGDGGSYIRTWDGQIQINTGDGTDRIYADDGDVTINTGNGRKIIYADKGRHNITTGNGNDYIRLGDGEFDINAGDGNNQIIAGHGDGNLITGNGYDRIQTGSGQHTIDVGDGGSHIRILGNGDNVIIARAGQDFVQTRNGNQTVSTGDGNDSVYTGHGNDIILTGTGNDYVSASFGNDIISLGAGNDIAFGGHGQDLLIGGDGRDKLLAGSGNDLLVANIAANEDDIPALQNSLDEWVDTNNTPAAIGFLGAITEDNDRDKLFGESGIDELFGGVNDWLYQ